MTHLLDSLHILLNPLELTFNLCTAHPSLLVSNDLHTVKYTPSKQLYPEHPERFTSAPQILCTKGFSGGEHIWVVEVGANAMWSLGICYKSIPRCGDHSRLGHNSVSWRLQWKNSKLTVCQSSCNVVLGEVKNHPQRVEIALDYEGGVLMFHSTKNHREHLYTFRTVYPGQYTQLSASIQTHLIPGSHCKVSYEYSSEIICPIRLISLYLYSYLSV